LNRKLFWAVSFQSVVKEIYLRFLEYALGASILAPVLAILTGSVVLLITRIVGRTKVIRN
jgi:hypothetical protein